MDKNTQLLVEAISSYLNPKHDDLGIVDTTEHDNTSKFSFQHMHEQINEMFRSKAADLTHYDGVCAAFRKTHDYKYITDYTFQVAFERDMIGQGIPVHEQQEAVNIVTHIIEELRQEELEAEKDTGFHPELDRIKEICQPEQYK